MNIETLIFVDSDETRIVIFFPSAGLCAQQS